MFSRKKMAAVSGLLGVLAVTGVGTAQAYAAVNGCTSDADGNVTCVNGNETVYKSRDGRQVLHQTKDCSTETKQRVVWPEYGVLHGGNTTVGPNLSCSNSAPIG